MIVTVLTGAVDKGNEKKAQMCAHHQPRSQVLSSSALPERETSLGERQDEGPGNEVGTSHQFLRTSYMGYKGICSPEGYGGIDFDHFVSNIFGFYT